MRAWGCCANTRPVHAWAVSACTHTHTHTHTHIIHSFIHTFTSHTHTYLHIYVHTYIHTYERTYTHTGTCTQTCMHAYMHTDTCMHACMPRGARTHAHEQPSLLLQQEQIAPAEHPQRHHLLVRVLHCLCLLVKVCCLFGKFDRLVPPVDRRHGCGRRYAVKKHTAKQPAITERRRSPGSAVRSALRCAGGRSTHARWCARRRRAARQLPQANRGKSPAWTETTRASRGPAPAPAAHAAVHTPRAAVGLPRLRFPLPAAQIFLALSLSWRPLPALHCCAAGAKILREKKWF